MNKLALFFVLVVSLETTLARTMLERKDDKKEAILKTRDFNPNSFSLQDAYMFIREFDSDVFGQVANIHDSKNTYRKELRFTDLRKNMKAMILKYNTTDGKAWPLGENIERIMDKFVRLEWAKISSDKALKTQWGGDVKEKKSKYLLAHFTAFASALVRKLLFYRNTVELEDAIVAAEKRDLPAPSKSFVHAMTGISVKGIANFGWFRGAKKERAPELLLNGVYLMEVYDKLQEKIEILAKYIAENMETEIEMIYKNIHHGEKVPSKVPSTAQDHLDKIEENVYPFTLLQSPTRSEIDLRARSAEIKAENKDKDTVLKLTYIEAKSVIDVLVSPAFFNLKGIYENGIIGSIKDSMAAKVGENFKVLEESVFKHLRQVVAGVNSDAIALNANINEAKAANKAKKEGLLEFKDRNTLYVLGLERFGQVVNDRIKSVDTSFWQIAKPRLEQQRDHEDLKHAKAELVEIDETMFPVKVGNPLPKA